MKKKLLSVIFSLSAVLSITALSSCAAINNAEKTINNAVSNINSTIENNPVTSLYSQINEKETQYDGNKLQNVLKNFYAGVISGTINEDTAGYLVTATLPKQNASASERKTAANELTVLSAIEQQGMQALYTDEYLSNFMYGNSKIVYKSSAGSNEFKGPITLDTKLGDIFG